MICEKIDLYAYFNIKRKSADCGGYLTVYSRTPINGITAKLRPAMLVIPGGGYGHVSAREGEPVALRFLTEGFSAFVLEYSINTAYPVPLLEAGMAVAYIKENAAKYNVDNRLVAAVGFSAGGHLAGMLATLFNDNVFSALGKSVAHVRPDAVIFSYPVITMLDGLTHESTRNVISGGGKIDYCKLSIENNITKNSPPAFIWHTAEDNSVPAENSFLLASAYKKAGVPFALHIFEKGGHGLSLSTAETSDGTQHDLSLAHVGKWVGLALDWLSVHGFKMKNMPD
ncbi:MAG: alpha/beta hydrolase [Clostridia bacterium]|nr:alpha/beta hydrolase [Clostridia bacterium]